MGLCPKGLRPLEVMLVVALVKLRQMLHSPAVFYFLLYFFFPSLQCKFLVSSRFSPFLARFTFQFPHDNMGCRLSKLLGAQCSPLKKYTDLALEFAHEFVLVLMYFNILPAGCNNGLNGGWCSPNGPRRKRPARREPLQPQRDAEMIGMMSLI